MEAAIAADTKPVKIRRLLPYWAVFQYDVDQTMRSWVYRTWVLVSVLAAVGYLLFRLGLHRGAGILQPASTMISDLLRWTILGSGSLIIILTVGSISAELGTLADSVLSRGISRYQYFLGKWHARLVTVLATFLTMGVCWLAGSYFLLHEDLSLLGGLWALVTVAALLGAVITCGVVVSAMASSTVLGIAIVWMGLYGLGALATFLPTSYWTPDRLLTQLPYILRGQYDSEALLRLIGYSAAISCAMALFGMFYFSRRDV